MEGPRPPKENELSSVVDFLDANLRQERDWSIQKEYPTALSMQNLQNIRIVKDKNGEILSHAVLRPILTKTPLGLFKVGAIGSVVTNEKHRNRGLSRQIIEECLLEAERQSCDFAVLWTNLYEFYRRFGFELAGTELSFIIDKDIPLSNTKALRLEQGNNVSPEALLRVFTQHTVSTIRTFEDVRRCLQIPQSRVFSAWNPEGSLEGYIVEGKGADLQGYIHEWGGSINALFQLINFARQSLKRPLTLITPTHSQNLVRHLNSYGFNEIQGYLGMIKIINPITLLAKVSRSIRFDHGIGDFFLEKRDKIFQFGVGERKFETDSERDIVRLIFGPDRPDEIHKFDPTTLSALNKVLPIPMWVWGWDSV